MNINRKATVNWNKTRIGSKKWKLLSFELERLFFWFSGTSPRLKPLCLGGKTRLFGFPLASGLPAFRVKLRELKMFWLPFCLSMALFHSWCFPNHPGGGLLAKFPRPGTVDVVIFLRLWRRYISIGYFLKSDSKHKLSKWTAHLFVTVSSLDVFFGPSAGQSGWAQNPV